MRISLYFIKSSHYTVIKGNLSSNFTFVFKQIKKGREASILTSRELVWFRCCDNPEFGSSKHLIVPMCVLLAKGMAERTGKIFYLCYIQTEFLVFPFPNKLQFQAKDICLLPIPGSCSWSDNLGILGLQRTDISNQELLTWLLYNSSPIFRSHTQTGWCNEVGRVFRK